MESKAIFYTQITKAFYQSWEQNFFLKFKKAVINDSIQQISSYDNKKLTNQSSFITEDCEEFFQNHLIMERKTSQFWYKNQNLQNHTSTLNLNIFTSESHKKLKLGSLELYSNTK